MSQKKPIGNILAPNNGLVYAVDITRAPLVPKTTNLTIVDGMLLKIDINKPSSVLAAAKVPLDILQAIVNIPSDLLTARIKLMEDKGTLTKAQSDLYLEKITEITNLKRLQQEGQP